MTSELAYTMLPPTYTTPQYPLRGSKSQSASNCSTEADPTQPSTYDMASPESSNIETSNKRHRSSHDSDVSNAQQQLYYSPGVPAGHHPSSENMEIQLSSISARKRAFTDTTQEYEEDWPASDESAKHYQPIDDSQNEPVFEHIIYLSEKGTEGYNPFSPIPELIRKAEHDIEHSFFFSSLGKHDLAFVEIERAADIVLYAIPETHRDYPQWSRCPENLNTLKMLESRITGPTGQLTATGKLVMDNNKRNGVTSRGRAPVM
ncbi:ubiquitin-specific protease doa4 [Elasticomyces elasticus]|nr:ubiquitin-specific protease doa4 [Elasticomyces elasticus]